ncbi:hypothetical protein [Bacillus cereus]|uniref:hypothetical protein n=1 Tax=Bacillus cereus TaxID=1396 RepID=UPI00397EEAA2
MIIGKKEMLETIEVFHNTREEMLENRKQLVSEGWSDNIRQTVLGATLVEMHIADQEDFKRKYPTVTIYEHGSNYYTNMPYVLCTKHERKVDAKNEIQK